MEYGGSTMFRPARGRLRAGSAAFLSALSIIAPFTSPTAAAASSAADPGAAARVIKINTRQLGLGQRRAGTYFGDRTSIIVNTSNEPVQINRIAFRGGDVSDFVVGTDCLAHGRPSLLAPKARCVIKAIFTPRAYGARTATVAIGDSASPTLQRLTLRGVGTEGYYIAGPVGDVAHFGDALSEGDRGKQNLNQPVISITGTSTGNGYWLLASDGGIFSYGDAKFYGSTGAMHLNRPVVAMATDRAINGYWLVASDGGIFTFGRAGFFGSAGGMHLNQSIIGMAATRSGHGYWLVGRDGGIFTFGDARFYGSLAGNGRREPIVDMAATPSGNGYWLVARDGHVFAFGDARVHGADGVQHLGVVVGMCPTSDGRGFWLLNSQAHVIGFGDARFLGDLHQSGITEVVGLAASAPGVGSSQGTGIVNAPNVGTLNPRLVAIAEQRGLRERPR
jgi:hypothetical protein